MITLNDGQKTALEEIVSAFRSGETRHALLGFAGTGKTTLMQEVVRRFGEMRIPICVTAPTHKAVSVLARKLVDADLSHVEACTIHSLLGLRPAPDGEKTTLKKTGRSCAFLYRAVVIDEASMVGEDLHRYIDSELKQHFVLFVGDPAQLPPVGEEASRCFSIKGRSNLATIVRQAAGNPIIQAASMIRARQDTTPGWEWAAAKEAPPYGIYRADDGNLDDWMKDAFGSEEFAADNDTFRYIAYTNLRVAEINAKVRGWRYGQTDTPFVVGERAICRTPILNNGVVVFSVNQEATVEDIQPSSKVLEFQSHSAIGTSPALPEWSVELPTWSVKLANLGGVETWCDVAQNPRHFDRIMEKVAEEARLNRARWYDRFQTKEMITTLQHVYAMTTHTSQGSTFGSVFVDIADMRRAEFRNPKEFQQLLYVAVTRASNAVVLIGAPQASVEDEVSRLESAA